MTRTDRPQIVVIDDHDIVSHPLKLLIQHHGGSARSYKSCESFLDELDPNETPDCLILDLHFPGMNGVELLHAIRDIGIRIPTIVWTAWPDGPLAAQALAAGVLDILTKPVDGDVLQRKIELAVADKDPLRRSGR